MSRTLFKLCPLALAVTTAMPAFAQQSPTLPDVEVKTERMRERRATPAAGSDSSRLLEGQPGYSSAAAGGVSGLPVLNGFADDRLKIRIDGMEITSACANHMNAPLSYTAPGLIGSIKLHAGVTPVSLGGDSIGGSIEVKSPEPVFASGDGLHREGRIAIGARSVDRSVSVAVSGTLATDSTSLSYSGSHSRGRSYKDGNGNTVLGSMYESNNSLVTLGLKGDEDQLVVRIGEQRIPFQGFPNEYMDMTGNHALFANATYTGEMDWGTLEAHLYWQDTEHKMGFFTPERSGRMPMLTHGRDIGYALKAELPLQAGNTLRLGHEFHRFTLDDWWPAVSGVAMMSPNDFTNINDGRRSRFVLFAEWEGKLAQDWSGLFGIRHEHVRMDSGNVQPYNSMGSDPAAANAFNARSKAKTDHNFDVTALARHELDATRTLEIGYARKTRSPNLYERYTWGRSSMGMSMNNWFGDGNGYVGDIDLKPEVAHTFSVSTDWHDAERRLWNVSVSPYYSRVNNYIDADVIGTFTPNNIAGTTGNLLRFANHDAKLYGINFAGQARLAGDSSRGEWRLRGTAGLTRGSRTDGNDLYRMMPLNATVALDHQHGGWTHTLETRLVGRKDRVDNQRLERTTAGYALVNLRTQYQLDSKTSVTAGISNLLDKQYADPMGGVYLSGHKSAGGPLLAMPGYGRSLDIGMSLGF